MRCVVIVGASLAGVSAARSLRKHGFDGTITLVGEEQHLPYQRPPLSKQFLAGTWDRARIDQRAPSGLEWILGSRATSLDVPRREVALEDGRRVPFDGLVIATGARARKPRWYAELPGAFTLRTVDDAIAIQAHVRGGARRFAIVGAGFIGSEVAATLRGLGCEVTLIDIDRRPMLRVLGETLASVCARLHEAHGVQMALGKSVDGFVGSTKVEGVRLADGSVIEADGVVVGVGVVPSVEWLHGSGIALDDGVPCDATCAVPEIERIVVAGDVARCDHPYFGSHRVEHVNNAIAQGDIAARTLLAAPGAAQPCTAIPFFWSDQYDCKLQLVGVPSPNDPIRVVEGGLHERKFVALFERNNVVTGAFLLNSPHRVSAYTSIVEDAARGVVREAAT
ncbi:MAG TPA: FAD-dependent oxidoreductase [Casimicrobiaceae bacterium]|nr:FAD-dependent oxidoreductase [Casimicrobiaceae bacterium]